MHGYAIKHFDQERLLQLPAVVESLHLPTIEPLMFVLGQWFLLCFQILKWTLVFTLPLISYKPCVLTIESHCWSRTVMLWDYVSPQLDIYFMRFKTYRIYKYIFFVFAMVLTDLILIFPSMSCLYRKPSRYTTYMKPCIYECLNIALLIPVAASALLLSYTRPNVWPWAKILIKRYAQTNLSWSQEKRHKKWRLSA